MKKCGYEGCTLEIDDKYSFCFNHYKPGSSDMNARPSGQWASDPVVDALLKMNSNLGTIAQQSKILGFQLEEIERQLQKINETLQEKK